MSAPALGVAVQGWIELRTVGDLLKKLERDLKRLERHPQDADQAFNFFVTAEHLLDWQHPGKANRRKRCEAREKDVLLGITSHLANGAKHFKVEAKQHKSVKAVKHSGGLFPSGYWPRGYFAPGYWGDGFYVELDGDAAKKLGPRIAVVDLARKVLHNWRNRLAHSP